MKRKRTYQVKTSLFSLIALTLIISGCSTAQRPRGLNPDSVYDQVYREGGRDIVKSLKEGLRQKQVYGTTDPYIPLRTPDQIMPVWAPARIDKQGRRIEGRWENTIIRRSQWYTD